MPSLLAPALIFTCNAMLYITFFNRLPNIAAGLEINKAVLGLLMLGGPIGTLLALPLAGRVTRRLTPKNTALLFLGIKAIILPLASVAPIAGFFIIFVAYGFASTILEVAQNMIATDIERKTGEKVLSRSHGFWSVGLFLGTMFAAFMGLFHTVPFIHQAVVSIGVFACMAFVYLAVPNNISVVEEKGNIFVIPTLPIILICTMMAGLSITEGTLNDWGIFFLKEELSHSATSASLLFACSTIGMGAMRMFGDRLRMKYDNTILLRFSALTATLGVLLLVYVPVFAVSALALTLIGVGIALVYPIAVSAIVRAPGLSEGDSLAALSMTLTMAHIGIPPLMGFVAETWSLSVVFLILIPLIAVAFILSPIANKNWPTKPKASPLPGTATSLPAE